MNRKWTVILIRAVCILLALLMVLGFVIMILPGGSSQAYGTKYTENFPISVGLAYGANAPATYTITAPAGFSLGYVHQDQFTTVFTYESGTSLAVCQSDHLKKTEKGYIPAAAEQADLGGYHIEFDIDPAVAGFETQFADIAALLSEYGLPVFPAFVGKELKVRAGCYKTLQAVTNAANKISAAHKLYCRPVSPSSTGLTLIDPDAGKAVFAFDCGTSLYFGAQASKPQKGSFYIAAPDGYTYDGVIRVNRAQSGLCVANLLPVETYVEGVLPYEISSSWNLETQKAFAVAVRSYTLANLDKHEKTYGFDLCNTTDCQVYRGVQSVNTKVKEAVAKTKNQVLSYQGVPFAAYYSSSTGGCTASAYDVWGGSSFPYLAGVATPWEQYNNYSGGAWSAEISASALYEALKSKGYTGLSGPVAEVTINSYAAGSTYVSSITFTDKNGKSIIISKCDRIRLALSSYLKSANFVVAKGGGSVTVTDFALDVDYDRKTTVSGVQVLTYLGEKILKDRSAFRVASGSSTASYTDGAPFKIILSAGTARFSNALVTASVLPDITAASVSRKTRTIKAPGSSDNFVFIGRGNGHGVGLSQYGAKDLGDIGYPYDVILTSYFPDAEIINMTTVQ